MSVATPSHPSCPTAHGVVVLHGRQHAVQVVASRLWLDARAWFAWSARGARTVAGWVADKGDADGARDVARMADEIEALLVQGHFARNEGILPQLAYRAALPLWSVDSASDAEHYARLMLEHSAPCDEGAAPEFAFEVGDAGAALFLAPRLADAAPHVGSYVRARVVEAGSLGHHLDQDPEGRTSAHFPPPLGLGDDAEAA